jgi:hypothetical protein
MECLEKRIASWGSRRPLGCVHEERDGLVQDGAVVFAYMSEHGSRTQLMGGSTR